MADVLAFTVPTFPLTGKGRYPSVNHLGSNTHRSGRKTPEYHALFDAVRDAAKVEVIKTGWIRADYYVEVIWKRYVTTRRSFDAMNALKCELDAMKAAEVYDDDLLVIPKPDVPQYDPTPGAIDRIVLVVIRTYPPAILAVKAKAPVDFAAVQAEARRRTAKVNASKTGIGTVSKAQSIEELKNGDIVPRNLIAAILKGNKR